MHSIPFYSQDLGLGRPHQINFIRTLLSRENEIAAHINSYAAAHSCGTLFDCQASLLAAQGVKTFEARARLPLRASRTIPPADSRQVRILSAHPKR